MRKERAFTPRTENTDDNEISRQELMKLAGCERPYYLNEAIKAKIFTPEKVQVSENVVRYIYLTDYVAPLREFIYNDTKSGDTVIFR